LVRTLPKADEKSWQARYDFNFASIGIPGLILMTATSPVMASIELTAPTGGKEWERNTDISYVFQEGALKNLGIKWRKRYISQQLQPRRY